MKWLSFHQAIGSTMITMILAGWWCTSSSSNFLTFSSPSNRNCLQNHQDGWEPDTRLKLPEQMIGGQPSSPCLQISAQRHLSWGPKGFYPKEKTKNFCSQSPSTYFSLTDVIWLFKKSHNWRTADVTVVRDSHNSFPALFTERKYRPCMACFHQVFFYASLSYYVFATNWILSSYLDKKESVISLDGGFHPFALS